MRNASRRRCFSADRPRSPRRDLARRGVTLRPCRSARPRWTTRAKKATRAASGFSNRPSRSVPARVARPANPGGGRAPARPCSLASLSCTEAGRGARDAGRDGGRGGGGKPSPRRRRALVGCARRCPPPSPRPFPGSLPPPHSPVDPPLRTYFRPSLCPCPPRSLARSLARSLTGSLRPSPACLPRAPSEMRAPACPWGASRPAGARRLST